MTENSVDLVATELLSGFEGHRPFLRRLDKRFATTYGFGGTLIFLIGVGLPALVGWRFHLYTYPLLYIVAFIMVGVGFMILRSVVRRRRQELRQEYESYCEINKLDPRELALEVKADGIYTFVTALYEEGGVDQLATDTKP